MPTNEPEVSLEHHGTPEELGKVGEQAGATDWAQGHRAGGTGASVGRQGSGRVAETEWESQILLFILGVETSKSLGEEQASGAAGCKLLPT